MISDSAAILLAVGPAAVTGAAGYWSARLQTTTRIKELEHDAAARRREERVAACSEYFAVDLALMSRLMSGLLTSAWYDEWEDEYGDG